MEDINEITKMCEMINFIEDDALFGCLEPIKYKVIFEGVGVEGFSCQRHYKFFKDDVEKKGMTEFIKFVEINNDE